MGKPMLLLHKRRSAHETTTLSFLVGHLQKSSPIHSHNCTSQMLTNNASSLLLPIRSHNCTSQMRTNNASSLLLPIRSHNCTSQMRTNNASSSLLLLPIHKCALATTLLVATALNEIVISNMKESIVGSCKAQDLKPIVA